VPVFPPQPLPAGQFPRHPWYNSACLRGMDRTTFLLPACRFQHMEGDWLDCSLHCWQGDAGMMGPSPALHGSQMTRLWLQRTWSLVSDSGESTAQLPLVGPAWGPHLIALHSASRANTQVSLLRRASLLPGHSPTQFFPSGVRSYPSWHRHWKEPMLLMHWPFRHTCPTRDEHSSMSVGGK